MLKKFLFISLLLVQSFTVFSNESSDYEEIKNEANLKILTPDLAERQVFKMRLKNGLEAFIISDPRVDKSGAALYVSTGSWDDPQEYPGIAHFLEHMLFLGTEKYPQESGYQRYIAENGGETNAFTGAMQTSYLFSINNNAFEEALDRFSEFFKHPLFNPSGVSRELHAIDQEYSTHLDNDDMRTLMVDKELANPKHPYHNFAIGNSKTLGKVSQEVLKEWYRNHYSANLMRLIVYSNLPLEKLKQMVVDDFKDVPTTHREVSHYAEALSKEGPPSITFINSVKNSRTLTIIWELPKKFSNMLEDKPANLLCHILGHEGQESLLSLLKKENLADKLQCGAMRLSPDNYEMYLEIELTDQGISRVNDVIFRLYQAIRMLKENTYPRYIFDEVQAMAILNYQYQTREDAFRYMMKHAGWGSEEALSTYPEKMMIVQQFSPERISSLLEELTPQKARYLVTAPVKITEVEPRQKEKWMGIEYAVRPVDDHSFTKWLQAGHHADIQIPAPNPYIPQSMKSNEIQATSQDATKPLVPKMIELLNDGRGKIYFAQDDQRYNVPQVTWIFEFKTPEVDMGNPNKTVLTDLYVKSITEALNGITYPAELAGLSYEIRRKDHGISLRIQGYSEKAGMLLNTILQQIKSVRPTETQFDIYQDYLRREYQNFAKKSPLEQAAEYFKSVIYKKFVTEKQKAIAINRISYEKFNDFLDNLFTKTYVQGVIYGDTPQKEAEKVINQILTALDAEEYPQGPFKRPEVILFSKDQGPYYWEVTTKAQGNAVLLGIENPTFSFKERGAQQIIMQALEMPFFANLRTKQQTGYAVYSTDREVEKQLFDIFAVQSSTHDARDLLARFELFIETFLQELSTEVSESTFDIIKDSVLCELKQPQKTIREMAELLFKLAFEYDGDFDWLNKRIEALENLSYGEFKEFAYQNLGKSNRRRIAILLRGAKNDDSFNYSPMGSLLRLRKVSRYTGDETEK